MNKTVIANFLFCRRHTSCDEKEDCCCRIESLPVPSWQICGDYYFILKVKNNVYKEFVPARKLPDKTKITDEIIFKHKKATAAKGL